MTIATYRWTLDRYHHAVDAGVFADEAVELLNGEIVLMSPEGVPHSSSSDEAAEYLRDQLRDLAKVREAKPITLPNDSEPEPDIAIVQLPIEIYRSHHPYVENIYWVIEYADSSLSKDTELKRKTYAVAGIREYWVVNLRASALLVYRDPITGDYQSQQAFTNGEIRSIAFPEIAISVRRLLG